jgi:hypothetical protein
MRIRFDEGGEFPDLGERETEAMGMPDELFATLPMSGLVPQHKTLKQRRADLRRAKQ